MRRQASGDAAPEQRDLASDGDCSSAQSPGVQGYTAIRHTLSRWGRSLLRYKRGDQKEHA